MLHFGDLTVVCLHGHREVAHAQGPEGGEELRRDIFPHLRRVEWAYTCRHGPHHLRHCLAVAHRLQHFFAAVCLPQRLILLLQPPILTCYFCGDMITLGFWLKNVVRFKRFTNFVFIISHNVLEYLWSREIGWKLLLSCFDPFQKIGKTTASFNLSGKFTD